MTDASSAAAGARSAWRAPHVHITELQNPAQAGSGPIYTTNACFCGGQLGESPGNCCQIAEECCNMPACLLC